MKNELFLETKPVKYSAAGIKTIGFKVSEGEKCFLPHWHDRIEIIRINSGKLYVECENERFELSENTLLVIPPKRMHKGYTLDSAVDYSIVMFDIRSFYNDTELCKTIMQGIFERLLPFSAATSDNDVINCFDEIFESNKSASLYTVSSVYKFISLLYEKELIRIGENTGCEFFKQVLNCFDENIAEEITVSMLSEKFGYSEAHFCRKFKAVCGLSPMTYLKIYRLDMACRDVKNSDMAISDIAEKHGFPDANYFTRCFKERYEVSPLKYRKLNKQ